MFFRNPLPHAVRNAKDLRKRVTRAEKILWNAVRNRKFHNYKIRRQVPVGKFIADFLCTDPLLIIELDGLIHESRAWEDQQRTQAIMDDYGIPVVRLKNHEILDDLPKALRKIELCLQGCGPHPPTSPPGPSPARRLGEGSFVEREENLIQN